MMLCNQQGVSEFVDAYADQIHRSQSPASPIGTPGCIATSANVPSVCASEAESVTRPVISSKSAVRLSSVRCATAITVKSECSCITSHTSIAHSTEPKKTFICMKILIRWDHWAISCCRSHPDAGVGYTKTSSTSRSIPSVVTVGGFVHRSVWELIIEQVAPNSFTLKGRPSLCSKMLFWMIIGLLLKAAWACWINFYTNLNRRVQMSKFSWDLKTICY